MSEAARLFAAADTVALPYQVASQSGVLLLAYGFRRPVVVYPVGGMAEAVIDGETGWICARSDAEALVAALAASVEAGPEECLRRGEAGERLASGALLVGGDRAPHRRALPCRCWAIAEDTELRRSTPPAARPGRGRAGGAGPKAVRRALRRAPYPRRRCVSPSACSASSGAWSTSAPSPSRSSRPAARRSAPAPPARRAFSCASTSFPTTWPRTSPSATARGAYRPFHELMRDAGVPYLIAVLPRVSADPLNPQATSWRRLDGDERELLRALPAEGVSFGLHGLDHRTRDSSPRRHSELCGLSAAATEELLDTAMAELEPSGIRPRVFVPPYNRFDAAQYEMLARRFDVVCGGPESVGLLGFQRTPVWRGEAVYLPSYHPLYGHAREVRRRRPGADRAPRGSVGADRPALGLGGRRGLAATCSACSR